MRTDADTKERTDDLNRMCLLVQEDRRESDELAEQTRLDDEYGVGGYDNEEGDNSLAEITGGQVLGPFI